MPDNELLPNGARESFWTERARLLSVMAHPTRLAILEILCDQPRCVKHINALVPLAQSHLSQHLAALRKANLVASLACGALRCYYILRPSLVKDLIRTLSGEHPLQYRDCRSIVAAQEADPQMDAEAARA